MKIVEFSLERRVTVAMVAIAVSLFGVVAFTRLPINLLPDISYPSLTVESRYAGAAPAEIEALVTRPVEEAVGVVAGVQRMTSVSRPGLSQVTLEFDWGRNMDFAALDVRQKLDLVILPEETTQPVLLRFDPANDPVLRLYVTGSDDLYQLRYLGEEVLKKDLESAEGLAAVKVNGGFEEEIQVRIDEGKLALLGMSIQEVRDRLRRENINQAGGSLYEQEARYLVRARNEFQDLGDILDTVLLHRDGRLVTLADVATVERGHRKREVITRFDGQEAVELALYKEGDANTVEVAEAIATRLESIEKELPEGISVVTGVDQSRFIQASIREVLSNAALGGGIAILILLLFLKDARSTLVIGISIPLSIITTFFLMFQTGTSLNIMSLGGLALGVGMLVDNAIVVLEAIYKQRERGFGAFEAARRGASEVGTAVIASTLTTVAVFLPVVFLQGVAAQLFRDQALTVSFSLVASLAVSLTLIPMLAALLSSHAAPPAGRWPTIPRFPRWPFVTAWPPALGRPTRLVAVPLAAVLYALHVILVCLLWLLRSVTRWVGAGLAFVGRPVGRLFDRGMDGFLAAYPRVLRRALAARGLVVGLAVAALAATALLIPGLGLDLIPVLSQGEFSFRVELPEGTPLPSTDRLVSDLAAELAGDPRVESYSAIAGGAGLTMASTGTEGENVARIQVRMAEGTSPADEDAVAAELRSRLAALEAVRFKFERPSVFTFRTPIEVELYGDDVATLHTTAQALRDELAEVPGLVDVKTSAELGNPELQVTFNRDQLVKLGLDLSQVAETVRNKIQGDVATRFTQGDREIDIVVRSVVAGEASAGDVGELIIGQHTPGGGGGLAAAGANPRRPDGGDVDQMNRLDRFNLVGAEGATASGPTIPLRLKTVADVTLAKGPSEIRRIAQKRAAVIAGNLADRDMGAVAADVEALLDREAAAMPAGIVAKLSGQHEEMESSFRSLLLAMALAIFLVYLVMASQFESFLHPFVIIFTLPLGAIGVVAALAVTGTTVNVVALIGAVMLAGIVVNNAIVLIDAVNRLRREEGLGRDEALILAGQQRLRPILMTSATTIFGLLPMALGLGEGAELRAPLAITVIGGLTVATGLTLVVIPVVYSLLDRERLPADLRETAAAPRAGGDDLDGVLLSDPDAATAG